jgi:hypothetical protein
MRCKSAVAAATESGHARAYGAARRQLGKLLLRTLLRKPQAMPVVILTRFREELTTSRKRVKVGSGDCQVGAL